MESNGSQHSSIDQTPQPHPLSDPSSHKKAHLLLFLVAFGICIFSAGTFFLITHEKKIMQLESTQNQTTNPTMQTTTQKVTYTKQTLTKIKGSPANTDKLPLGDNKYTTSGPKKGYIYLCNVQPGGGGAQASGSWIQGTTWDLTLKPTVSGTNSWPNALFMDKISGNNRLLSGNDLPVNTNTGTFPVAASDPAYQYDRNPNSIQTHTLTLNLPINPTALATPACMGGEVGIMNNGVPLFNGFDAEHRDAPAREIQDSCDGHPQEQGEYHYHNLSRCIKDIHETTVIGYALDGYPITGPVLPNGNYLTSNDLDECHGMTSEISIDGQSTTTYHYVMTEDFPYSVSCFHAKPVQMQVIQTGRGGNQAGNQQQNKLSNQKQPPQAAIDACAKNSSGDSCSFSVPNGIVMGTCQTPPNQTSLICVPSNRPQ